MIYKLSQSYYMGNVLGGLSGGNNGGGILSGLGSDVGGIFSFKSHPME